MKFTYEAIRQNIRFYEQAKEQFPIISQFEKGEVSTGAMNSLKLGDFAEFYNFRKLTEELNFELDKPISWKKLKEIIVQHTKVERFKTYVKNRTQKDFVKLLTENGQTYDRLLNGRWLRKPNRRGIGRRHSERADGLSVCFVPIMNYIICNEIDTFSVAYADDHKSFHEQSLYWNKIKWFLKSVYNNGTGETILESALKRIPHREVEISTAMMKSLADFIQDSEIDFRKLNSDFIIEIISKKIKKFMEVPTGTVLNCTQEVKYGTQLELTEGKSYHVITSNIQHGFVRVCVLNDRGVSNYYDYSKFEDVSLQRDLLLSQLGII
jgi:hypothetical protein